MDGGVLSLCDHASPALPQAYGDLGLSPDHFTRHIAYDIGAAALTESLAARFGAPALFTTFSRLLIDPKASLFLIGTVMDYEEEKLKSGFVFRNPNEKGRCGCGESFHV